MVEGVIMIRTAVQKVSKTLVPAWRGRKRYGARDVVVEVIIGIV